MGFDKSLIDLSNAPLMVGGLLMFAYVVINNFYSLFKSEK